MSGLPDPDDLRRQLTEVVGTRLLDPLEILLDGDRTVDTLRTRVYEQTQVWTVQLLGPDGRQARFTAARLVATLYPDDAAFDPPAAWWATPLGRVVARRVGHPGAHHVSYAVAGAMLGVTRQAVHDLIQRGKLDRHPDGGVRVTSVRARLSTLEAPR
ncbi:hypothetical protein [Actinocatenispora sera]|uniref:Uncharacterized protein n=1 Tax=Actinocatenispora sera TaxID=390989 RepID=A0A810L6P5_9ACTN|nr:hypothetical protein [Actinocatenispora sera]BCJ29981.1 hypothetical protein Asera_40890 [Actinocatenispora sera]